MFILGDKKTNSGCSDLILDSAYKWYATSSLHRSWLSRSLLFTWLHYFQILLSFSSFWNMSCGTGGVGDILRNLTTVELYQYTSACNQWNESRHTLTVDLLWHPLYGQSHLMSLLRWTSSLVDKLLSATDALHMHWRIQGWQPPPQPLSRFYIVYRMYIHVYV